MALFDLTTLNDMAIDAPAKAISNCSSSQSTPIKSTVNWVPFPVRLGSHDSKWNVVMKALLFLAIIILAGAREAPIFVGSLWNFHEVLSGIVVLDASSASAWKSDPIASTSRSLEAA